MTTATESPQVLAAELRLAADKLNERIREAQDRGLIVEAEILSTGTISNPNEILVNITRISEPL